MNYEETLDYLYNSAPLFQHIGKDAYKAGLENTYLLDEYFNHPHRQFRTIHIAGTNGKGSCSHTLAAILQSAGYKTGLYTSPHLIDFRERIRVNGIPVSKEYVIDFVEKHRVFFEPLHPSFFELTTAMAFHYFAQSQIDVAIIEVGLGGRIDCTNIIRPDLCVITNISFDHIQFLGNTLAKIATEKAGIIKEKTPVVIGETTPETKPIFTTRAKEVNAPIYFAEEEQLLHCSSINEKGKRIYQTTDYLNLEGELEGLCQLKNTNTLLSAIRLLKQAGYQLTESNIRKGFSQVCELTGLMGRWQKLESEPTLICDTGHNVGGISYIIEQLKHQKYERLHIVIGMVNDKDIDGVLSLMPQDAFYFFTQASVERAMPVEDFAVKAMRHGLSGTLCDTVQDAVEKALRRARENDLIFIGGSTFIVADALPLFMKEDEYK